MKFYALILIGLLPCLGEAAKVSRPKPALGCQESYAALDLGAALAGWREKNKDLATEIDSWLKGRNFPGAQAAPKLSKSQIADLLEYVEEYHYEINMMLRKGEDLAECPYCLEFFNRLSKSLKAMPGYEGVVYRGANIRNKEVLKNLLQEGSVFKDPAFMSSSLNPATADRFRAGSENILFVIHSKTGKDIHPFVDGRIGDKGYPVFESEVLFLPGTEFKVQKVIHKPGEASVVFLEEII